MTTPEPEVPDLRLRLAEASRPAASVTVPLKQALAEQIRQAEAELTEIAEDAPAKRMGATPPLKAKAQEIESLRARMKASEMAFRFEALTSDQRDQIRQDMAGRDNPDEVNLRAIAAMCTEPAGITWTDLRDLRDRIGVNVFDSTIDAAATRASGGDWSVPFSSAASHILGTAK
jgi:hypothetical protein